MHVFVLLVLVYLIALMLLLGDHLDDLDANDPGIFRSWSLLQVVIILIIPFKNL